jgi:hypothetical protein
MEKNELRLLGIVKDTLKVKDSYLIDIFIKDLKQNTEVEVIIRPVKDFRSLKLNRTYWMYLGMIADYLGHTKEEMHDYFKAKFLCEWHQVNGEETLVCQSTAKLSNREFCEYLEKIFWFCSHEMGYVLPDIEDIREIKKQEDIK